jgi:hypothetical protein
MSRLVELVELMERDKSVMADRQKLLDDLAAINKEIIRLIVEQPISPQLLADIEYKVRANKIILNKLHNTRLRELKDRP